MECSQLDRFFETNDRRELTPLSVPGPLRGRNGKAKTRQVDNDDAHIDEDDNDTGVGDDMIVLMWSYHMYDDTKSLIILKMATV